MNVIINASFAHHELTPVGLSACAIEIERLGHEPWKTILPCWNNGGPSWGALGEKQVEFDIFLQCQQAVVTAIRPAIKEKDIDQAAGKYAS
jgi:hypothetical protein